LITSMHCDVMKEERTEAGEGTRERKWHRGSIIIF
jgi:hypothetical protein